MTAQILVPLTGAKRDGVALSTAFAAAAPLEAHVLALFTHADPRESVASAFTGFAGAPAPLSPETVEALIDSQTKLAHDAEEAARDMFITAANKAGVNIVERPSGRVPRVTCSIHTTLGFAPHVIAGAARLADLVVFGPLAITDGPDMRSAFVDTLTRTERPVILAQAVTEKPFARHVAIGWDGSTAASHAISASLPFLKRAATVELLVVTKAGRHGAPTKEALEYLAAHRITASSRTVDANDEAIGQKLLEVAARERNDLLVMGGYGHSQWQEALFGGPTQYIISHPTVPIFLMH